nr:MAG TPA: hypothetical protein [Caudoviricetes sp.]
MEKDRVKTKKESTRLSTFFFGAPTGTRTPDRPVMSKPTKH